MSLLLVIAEAARAARAQRVTSALVALLCGAVCTVALLTVGGTAAAEAQVLGRVEAAGSRLLVVTDKKNTGLVTPVVIDVLNGLDTVEKAVGVDIPFDVSNGDIAGGGGAPAPAWTLSGPLTAAVTLTAGRWPRPGEAIVSARGQRVLGLELPAGGVVDHDGHEHAVVGRYAAAPAFEFLQTGVVIAADPTVSTVRSVYVVVDSVASARITERAVVATIGPPDLTVVSIESPAALADLQRAVGGDLGGYRRALLLVVQAAGGFLVAVVVLAEVLLRRRDLGRRRALGASRPGLLFLVVARTAVAAIPGVLVGCVLGALAAHVWAQPPPLAFGAGTGLLTMFAAMLAATPPALLAAWRDPVAVLRTA